MNARQARDFYDRLQTVFPTPFPVRLSFVDMGPAHREGDTRHCDWGETVLGKEKDDTGKWRVVIRIKINRDLFQQPTALYLVLIHEYAHAMSWAPTPAMSDAEQYDHQPEWGICEARLWSSLTDIDHDEAARPF